MPQMTPSQARAVDAVLSKHAQGYKNSNYVLEGLFPEVPVLSRGGKVIKFGKEAFRRYNTRRAPGTKKARMQFGYGSGSYNLNQDSMEAVTPVELQQESSLIDIDLQAHSVEVVLDSMYLSTEYERAQIATNSANYSPDNLEALSGTDQWDDSAVKPKKLIDDVKEQVRKRVGQKANVLVMSSQIHTALENANSVQSQFRFTSNESITTQMLERYFKVDKILVPEAVSLPAGADESDDFEDVWGNHVVAAYVPPVVRNMHVPSFGYTYRLKGYPMVKQAYFDDTCDSYINGVTFEEKAHMTSDVAGVLISNVLGG